MMSKLRNEMKLNKNAKALIERNTTKNTKMKNNENSSIFEKNDFEFSGDVLIESRAYCSKVYEIKTPAI